MRYPVPADREHAGVGENDFIQIQRRRIAVESRLHVAYQQSADLRQAPQKNLRQVVRTWRTLAEFRRRRFTLAAVAQAMLNFALELRHQGRRHLLDMLTQVAGIQVLPSE